MPSSALLLPIALPLVAAGVIAALGAAGLEVGRLVSAGAAWASVASILALWLPVRSTQELILGQMGFGSGFDLRLDAVGFAFGLMVSVPAAVVLTLQKRSWQEAALATLALGASMAAVEAGGVVLTAIAGGAAATAVVLVLDTEDPRARRPSWAMLLAGWLALAWAGTILQVRGGTAVYSAVPVSSITWQVASLLAVAALLASGLLPWRSWPSQVWSRPSLRAAGMGLATLYPLGFYIVVRVYDMGDGRYPLPAFNGVLSVLGLAVALVAALRAQAATTRREFFGEVVPVFGGFALMSLALGTPLGLSAALVALATTAVLAAAVALLPDRASIASLAVVAAAVGIPPSLAFGSRVLGIEATFEAGDFLGLIGLGGTLVWVLMMVAGARAAGLPAGRGRPVAETSPAVALGIAVATIVAGPALALFQASFANPAAAEVMPSAGSLGGSLQSVATVSTVLPAVALFVPLLIIGSAAYLASGSSSQRAEARPPVLAPVAPRALAGWREAVAAARVPEQYRTILNLRELEAAASGGRPVLWLAALVALAFAVTR